MVVVVIIQAVLGGKSSGYEYKEDILTSTVFGTLKYLNPGKALIPFIESAFLYNESRTALWERLKNEGIELRGYREVKYIFWSLHPKYGEPDLMIIFSNHVHDEEELLLIVEAKFKSGKSSINENDQLARYFDAITADIESFPDSSVSNFKGKKGLIVYLTEAEAYTDIADTQKIIQSRNASITDNIFHLRWHQLYQTLKEMFTYYDSCEKIIAEDIMNYLEKLGLRAFSGISIPGKSLNQAISLPYPIFYTDKMVVSSDTYFCMLPDANFKFQTTIFYRGN